jgi:nicotinate-nucleotide adenylyltransferase
MSMQRVGIFGGTFDPVHIGHLRIAEEAVETLGLDKMLFVPAADPPHKPGGSILPFEHRRRMLELALRDNSRFMLSDVEDRMPGKSYTVKTLRRFIDEWEGSAELLFLVGMDAFLEMDTWWNYRELFQLASIVILRRPGHDESRVGEFLHRKISARYVWGTGRGCYSDPEFLPVYLLRNSVLQVSATSIRRLISQGRSVRYLVIPEVLRYIVEKNLYRTNSEA